MLTELLSLLNESATSEELFPGIDSSAFDEHSKFKKTPPTVDGVTRKIAQYESLLRAGIKHATNIKNIFKAGTTWGTQIPNTKPLTEMPWIHKYPLTKEALSSLTIATDSPNFNKIEQLVASHESTLKRNNRYDVTITRLKSKIQRVRAQEAERKLKDKSAAVPQSNIDRKDIPRILNVKYRTERWPTVAEDEFRNPYFMSDEGWMLGATPFAGHPAHFPAWKGKMRTMYYELSKWVDTIGHPELDLMYASVPGKLDGSQVIRYYMTNSDGSVIIANRSNQRIHVYAKSKRLDPSQPPIRWRMRRLLAKDLKWLADKLMMVTR